MDLESIKFGIRHTRLNEEILSTDTHNQEVGTGSCQNGIVIVRKFYSMILTIWTVENGFHKISCYLIFDILTRKLETGFVNDIFMKDVDQNFLDKILSELDLNSFDRIDFI